MGKNFFAVLANTFRETLRQPIFGVVVFASVIALLFAPSLVMFTLEDDNLLLQDIGLSTLLVAGLLLGVFAAGTTITHEIENKTVLTVVSKTIGRGRFLLAKFLGIAAAVTLAEYILALVLLMIVRYGVRQTASDEPDFVVVTAGCLAAGLACLVALAGNYLYRWRFTAAAILLGLPLTTLAILALAFIDRHWHYSPKPLLAWSLLPPVLLTVTAALVLTAVAVTLAARFNLTLTLVATSIIFLLGAMADPWLGPIAREGQGLASYAAWLPIAILPNLSFFVVANAIYQQTTLPLDYLLHAGIYALLYASGVLLFGILLFRNRQLG